MTFEAAEDLKELLGANIIAGLEITHTGGVGLAITWVAGIIFSASADAYVIVAAGGGSVVNGTRYINWETGAALTISASTATGNQVLIATVVASAGNIDSITEAGFDFSSVTGLSGRPVIRLKGDKDPSDYKSYGQIIIGQENLNRQDKFATFRELFYRIIVTLKLDKGVGPGLLKRIMAEIDSVFRVNDKTQEPDYLYELLYSWNGMYTLGEIDIFVEIKGKKESL